MDIPSSCQRKPRLVFTCCSAWLLLLITHKFLELSRVYGYLDILISFHWHFLHFQRTCLPQVVVFWFGATALLLWQGQQTGSPAASRAARPAELRGLDAIMFLCNTQNILCDQRAGAGSSGSPSTQCGYLSMPILLWECLRGGWCWARSQPTPSRLPAAAGKTGTISLQLLLRNRGLNPALSIFRQQTKLKYLSLHNAGCLNQFQADVRGGIT